MIRPTRLLSSTTGGEPALIAVLTDLTTMGILDASFAAQTMPHALSRFERSHELLAFLDDALAMGRPADAALIDLRVASAVVPGLAARRHRRTTLIAVFAGEGVPGPAIETAVAAGAFLVSGTLSDPDTMADFIQAVIDHWFGRTPV